jgi:drug/metabolite transporter (DMT)-like permease
MGIANGLVVLSGMILLGSGNTLAYWFGALCSTAGVVCMVRGSRTQQPESQHFAGLDGIAMALAILLVLVGGYGVFGSRPPGTIFGWLYVLVGATNVWVLAARVRSGPNESGRS